MKTIVALVDFSDVTFQILKHARLLATAFDSDVFLLHFVPPAPVMLETGMAATLYQPPSSEQLQAEQARMQELQESLTKFGVRAMALQIQGSGVEDLLAECRRVEADLILVGTHGHGALYNLVVGTVTDGVLKNPPCPVLVVPQLPEPASTSETLKEENPVPLEAALAPTLVNP